MTPIFSIPRLVTGVVGVLVALVIGVQGVCADEGKEFGELKNNIKRYTKNVYLGMAYDEAQKLLGTPTQRKVVDGKPGSVDVMWKLEGHFVNASIEPQHNQINSIGVHWIGKRKAVPSFQSILTIPFEVREKNGTEIIHLEEAQGILHWQVMQVPGSEDQVISVLTVKRK